LNLIITKATVSTKASENITPAMGEPESNRRMKPHRGMGCITVIFSGCGGAKRYTLHNPKAARSMRNTGPAPGLLKNLIIL
jgi:hypothetical protein